MEHDSEPRPPQRWPVQRVLLGIALGAVGVASVTAVLAQRADTWDVTRSGVTAGGGESSSGTYSLAGVVGQAITGRASAGGFSMEAGLLGGGASKSFRYLPLIASDGTY